MLSLLPEHTYRSTQAASSSTFPRQEFPSSSGPLSCHAALSLAELGTFWVWCGKAVSEAAAREGAQAGETIVHRKDQISGDQVLQVRLTGVALTRVIRMETRPQESPGRALLIDHPDKTERTKTVPTPEAKK